MDSTKTQTSRSSQVALSLTRTTASISIATTGTFRATVSVFTQTTVPRPDSLKQFEGRMVLKMTWLPQYEYSYTLQFQALKSKIKRKLTTVLETLDGFLSVQILRIFQSSVGVDFIVFASENAQVNASVVEESLIAANNTDTLDLPLTSVRVKQIEITTPSPPTTASKDEDKSIEQWVIILIVAAILVFLLVLIICVLVVSVN